MPHFLSNGPKWRQGTVRDVEKTLARVIRDTLFDGQEKCLIEPFNGARPDGAYASLLMLSCKPEDHEVYNYYKDESDQLWEELKNQCYCRLRIQFYGSGARERASNFHAILRTSLRSFDLWPITGYGFVGEWSDISDTILAKVGERTTMDLEVYALLSRRFKIDNIENVRGVIVHDGSEEPYMLTPNACRLTFGPNKLKE